MKINIKTITIIGAFVALSASVEAKTTNWNGYNSSDWNLASNWTNGLPGNSDTINIPSAAGQGYVHPIVTSSSLYTATINCSGILTIRGADLSGYMWDIVGGMYSRLVIENGVTFNNNVGTYYTGNNYGREAYLTVKEGASAIFKEIVFADISYINVENASTLIALDVFKLDARSETRISGGSSILTAQSSHHNRTTDINGKLILNDGIFATGKIGDNSSTAINIAATGTLELILSTSSVSKLINYYGSIVIADGATLTLDFDDISSIVGGESFDIFDATTIIGTFTTVNTAELAEGLAWDFSQLYTSGIVSVVSDIVIPEPSTYALIFGALALTFVVYRRKK